MINGMMTHYQWKVANSEQTISPEIIIRSIRIDNFHTKVIWNLQRIEDIIEHSSCPLHRTGWLRNFQIFESSSGLKGKSLKYWTGEKDLFHWPALHEAQTNPESMKCEIINRIVI